MNHDIIPARIIIMIRLDIIYQGTFKTLFTEKYGTQSELQII